MLLNTLPRPQGSPSPKRSITLPAMRILPKLRHSQLRCVAPSANLRLCPWGCFAGQKGQALDQHLQSLLHHGPRGDLLRALPAPSQHPPHGPRQMAPGAEPDVEQTISSAKHHPEEVSDTLGNEGQAGGRGWTQSKGCSETKLKVGGSRGVSSSDVNFSGNGNLRQRAYCKHPGQMG